MCVGKSPVSDARNELCEAFLSNDKCDWVWFWDDDQEVPPNFMDLLDFTGKAKLISGTVWMWKGGVEPQCHLLVAHGNFDERGALVSQTDVHSQEPYFVDAAGTGFLLVHRSVIEAAGPKPFGEGLSVQEDMLLCKKANASGERVLIVPFVGPNHVKPLPMNDVHAYAAAQARLAVEKAAKPQN